MKLTSDKVVRPALIAEMLDLKEVIIGQSMAVDSKDEFYDLWEDVAILFYKPES
ncbi:MAG: hypothetical protein GY749_46105, partial [Desulfobacteraceae bacterium]|nr:hypothetical protein [Desulfobacteraceae bacterium]